MLLLEQKERRNIKTLMASISLNTTTPDSYSVKSCYPFLNFWGGKVRRYKHLWKLKITLKVKILMWLMLQHRLLTRDRLVIRGWQGNPNCTFCYLSETVDHLFLHCDCIKYIGNKLNHFNTLNYTLDITNVVSLWE